MKALSQRGTSLSIDDFGTGYSSLNYLKRFPVTTLKIDRSFIRDALTSIEDQEIVRTIIAMAQNLNMHTVAEGVETLEQQEFLINQGCTKMQGFYISRPMPVEEVNRFLGRREPSQPD